MKMGIAFKGKFEHPRLREGSVWSLFLAGREGGAADSRLWALMLMGGDLEGLASAVSRS